MAQSIPRRRLADAYTFPGFRPLQRVRGIFGDPSARLITRVLREKKTICGACGTTHRSWYDRRKRRARDLSSADYRIYLKLEVRWVDCMGTAPPTSCSNRWISWRA
jgi:hypothetical protein